MAWAKAKMLKRVHHRVYCSFNMNSYLVEIFDFLLNSSPCMRKNEWMRIHQIRPTLPVKLNRSALWLYSCSTYDAYYRNSNMQNIASSQIVMLHPFQTKKTRLENKTKKKPLTNSRKRMSSRQFWETASDSHHLTSSLSVQWIDAAMKVFGVASVPAIDSLHCYCRS